MERLVPRAGACRPLAPGSSGAQLKTTSLHRSVPPVQIVHGQRQRETFAKVYGPSKTLRKHTPCAVSEVTSTPAGVTQNQPKGFDMKQIVALAGCAFDAYLEPDRSDLLQKKLDNGSTATIVASPHKFRDTWNLGEGLLHVTIIRANGLSDKDGVWNKSDPFAICTVDKSSRETPAVNGSHNPVWNKPFSYFVKDKSQDALEVELWDRDPANWDESLGTVKYPLKNLKNGKYEEFTVDIQKGKGTLTFQTKYVPFKGEDTEAISDVYEIKPRDLGYRSKKKPGVSRDWQDLVEMAGKPIEDMFDPVCFIDHKKSDTQAWVYQSDPKLNRKELVISFRGTEITNIKDVISDLLVKFKKLNIRKTGPLQSVQGTMKAHKGFLDAYRSVEPCVRDVVDCLTGGSSDWKVYVTGHSLGGALATLCALDLVTRETSGPSVEVATYGSPRVGNLPFSRACNILLTEDWRVSSKNDPIVGLPPNSHYHHVGEHVILTDGDFFFDGTDDREQRLSYLAIFADFIDFGVHHLANTYQAWMRRTIGRVRAKSKKGG
ncbi:hypothetical protein BSKO_03132 [Bryopsis sp. KO-2023]|nr:hypothetical protein BSKO_03132 [Bryopsis sp. KO-2023]